VSSIDPSSLVRLVDIPGLPKRTMREAVSSGELPGYLIGKHYFVPREALSAWIAARAATRPGVRHLNPGGGRGRKPAAPAADRAVDRALARGAVRRVQPAARPARKAVKP